MEMTMVVMMRGKEGEVNHHHRLPSDENEAEEDDNSWAGGGGTSVKLDRCPSLFSPPIILTCTLDNGADDGNDAEAFPFAPVCFLLLLFGG
jgi:hypothetical protein